MEDNSNLIAEASGGIVREPNEVGLGVEVGDNDLADLFKLKPYRRKGDIQAVQVTPENRELLAANVPSFYGLLSGEVMDGYWLFRSENYSPTTHLLEWRLMQDAHFRAEFEARSDHGGPK